MALSKLNKRNFGSIKQLTKMASKNQAYHKKNPASILFPAVAISMGLGMMSTVAFKRFYQPKIESNHQTNNTSKTLINWSGNHEVTPHKYWEPTTTNEILEILQYCNDNKIPLRPMGSGTSPNGIAFSTNGVINMRKCNKIINVDIDKKQITVEAGITIKDILNELNKYDMALDNIPSIVEQQIGGLISTGAHATGYNISPCDSQIISLKIITPSNGEMTLTPKDKLFYYARVGMGCLGIIKEVTIQCVNKYYLSEYIYTMTYDELLKNKKILLNNFKHVKFLWIPYTNKIIIVADKEYNNIDIHTKTILDAMNNDINKIINNQNKLRQLYCNTMSLDINQFNKDTNNDVLSFADMRSLLLNINNGENSLNTEFIKNVNNAELNYWENISKQFNINDNLLNANKLDCSQNLLTFDCGGQQLVYEICFKMDNNDDIPNYILFMKELLNEIELNNIPAPAPIEQRFTAVSKSKLSPAYSDNDNDKFTWVGIIMYLPTKNEKIRSIISNEFDGYTKILDRLSDKYNGIAHWAKVEIWNENEINQIQNRYKKKYGNNLIEFKQFQKQLDPNNILLNDLMKNILQL